jgi:hypothetical protein
LRTPFHTVRVGRPPIDGHPPVLQRRGVALPAQAAATATGAAIAICTPNLQAKRIGEILRYRQASGG